MAKEFLRTHSLPRFVLVGGIGFVVDAGMLLFLHHRMAMPVVTARLLSFAVAVTVTWWLNRNITFRKNAAERRLGEWTRYTAVNSLGGALNLAVFFLVSSHVGGPIGEPLPALAIASAVAMIFNYLGSRWLVFTGSRTTA